MKMYLDGKLKDGELLDYAINYVATNGKYNTIGTFQSGQFQNVSTEAAFDKEILAWTNYWNREIITSFRYTYKSEITPEIIKAMIAQESSMGRTFYQNREQEDYNRQLERRKNPSVNVMQSLSPFDSTLWIAAGIDPTEPGHYEDRGTYHAGFYKTDEGTRAVQIKEVYYSMDTAKVYGGPLKVVAQTISYNSDGIYLIDYTSMTARMSIAVGVGLYAYKLNVSGNGSVESALKSYRGGETSEQSAYVSAITTRLREMGIDPRKMGL